MLVLAACDKTPSSTVDAAPPPSGSAKCFSKGRYKVVAAGTLAV